MVQEERPPVTGVLEQSSKETDLSGRNGVRANLWVVHGV